jgi:hypothetical protein
MKRRHVLLVALVVLLAVGATTTLTLAQGPTGTGPALAPRASAGTAFTYQGQLKNAGNAVNGTCAMAFRLYDDPSGSGLIGSPITTTVPVTDGLFTAGLNFGSNAFDGNGRWLDIQVNCTGTYAPLTPRQQLTGAPHAIYASTAPWSGLSGVPAGFADGVDNGSSYQSIKVVAKSGGDFTTITAALDSITTASANDHYLIYVAPGTYTETVIMKPFVDIEGAGELATKITSGSNTGTIQGASDAELRFLTVENTGGLGNAMAIYNSSASPRILRVTALASGAVYNYGVYNMTSSPNMMNVTVSASGGTEVYGVANLSSSFPTMTNVAASALGGLTNFGVHNSSSSPTMKDVTAIASGGVENFGVLNFYSSPAMTNVTADARGPGIAYGVRNTSSSPAMTNVTASASGGGTNYGIYNSYSSVIAVNSVISGTEYGVYNTAGFGPYTVRVNNSQVNGGTNAVRNDPNFITLVAASQLSGGTVLANGGTVTCAGVYDENYTFYVSTCP